MNSEDLKNIFFFFIYSKIIKKVIFYKSNGDYTIEEMINN